ncbi:NAD(P)H-hydrate dehydratase [Sphingomonas gilva]|uniref:ADP-dependent (S)-NAD(P)H-hydrate dehydratase n=1 Tax=Sphingomonas gilva TaxID=2305907 RepID=A0A396RJT6_9SPHN|nr:NAD(P)H-hydrate dehydratase [Sphingomonas gilva]RHW16454.1 NAD(P)H-hydrate dehydratase [Sphingomonas gilva]
MSRAFPLDAAWRAANPLPPIGEGQDKHERGRVLAVGGSRLVPGALLLTGTAALRAGAGKAQLATVGEAATMLGVNFPEAAVIGLTVDDTGEIAADAAGPLAERAAACDALVIGPGMAERDQTAGLVGAACRALGDEAAVLLDAGALTSCRSQPGLLHCLGGRAVMTPHHGELARLLGIERDRIASDAERVAREAADRFGAVVMLKDSRTLIAEPGGGLIAYEGGVAGLGTAGSGDVLAGIAAGLLARGMTAAAAAGWAVWLHAQAGRVAAERIGALGFLARELLPPLPRLIEAASPRHAPGTGDTEPAGRG